MLNIFKLTDAINESAAMATGANINSIEAYEFIGTMEEATTEFNYQVMSEAVNIQSFKAVSDEIMTEAVVSNPGSMEILSENVFSKLKEGFTKFIDKIIAMVKGVIEKLKAFFFKLTGKTDKWLNIMRPKIQDAQRRGGSSDFTYEMHKWNTKFVTEGLKGVVGSFMDYYYGEFKGMSAKKFANVVKSIPSDMVKSVSSDVKGENPDTDKTKAVIKTIDDAVDEMKDETEKGKEEDIKKLAELLKSAGASSISDASLDSIWKSVDSAATGGDRVSVKIASEFGIDSMIKGIESSKKTIDDLKKYYDNHLKKLAEIKREVESKLDSVEIKNEDKLPTEVVSSMRAYISTYTTTITSDISRAETILNNVRGKNVTYIQNMTTDFMNALTKFSGIKSKKD